MTAGAAALLALGCGGADSEPEVSMLSGAPVAVADGETVGLSAEPSGLGDRRDRGTCREVSRRSHLERRPADIIWVIDNSASMYDEVAAVERNMNRFSERIAKSGVDARVVVISACSSGLDTNGVTIAPPLGSGSDCPGDGSPPEYTRVARRVGSDDALEAVIETYPDWAFAMRPEATKTFVVVSDDDAAMSAGEFSERLAALDPLFAGADWLFSGIFCTSACPSPERGYDVCASPGSVYETLVEGHDGVYGDLCRQDFDPVFDRLAEGVIGASPIECALRIPEPPDGETLDPARVNVSYLPPGDDPEAIALGAVDSSEGCDPDIGGWYYGDPSAPEDVRLCEKSCDDVNAELGTRLEVSFGCLTRLLR